MNHRELVKKYLAEEGYKLDNRDGGEYHIVTKENYLDSGTGGPILEHITYPIHLYFHDNLKIHMMFTGEDGLTDTRNFCLYDPNSLQKIVNLVKSTIRKAWIYHQTWSDTGKVQYTTTSTPNIEYVSAY